MSRWKQTKEGFEEALLPAPLIWKSVCGCPLPIIDWLWLQKM